MEKADILLDLLKSRTKVEVEVDIETEFYDNTLKIVNALIPGSDLDQDEFIFYAHLDHFKPSAGDNASGCAALARSLGPSKSLFRKERSRRRKGESGSSGDRKGPGASCT